MAKVVKKNMELKYVVRRAVAKGVIALTLGGLGFVGLGIVGSNDYETIATKEYFELDGKTRQELFLEKGDTLKTPSGKIKAKQDMTIVVTEKGEYRILD